MSEVKATSAFIPKTAYTVADLIAVLRLMPAEAPVSAYSGCHDCGGPQLEVELHEGAVTITGDDGRTW